MPRNTYLCQEEYKRAEPWGSCNNTILSADQFPSNHCRDFLPSNKMPGVGGLTVPSALSVSAAQDQTWNSKEAQFPVSLLEMSTGSLLFLPQRRTALVQHEPPKWPFLYCWYPKEMVRWDIHTGLSLCFFHLVQHLNTETSGHRALHTTVWLYSMFLRVSSIHVLYQVP